MKSCLPAFSACKCSQTTEIAVQPRICYRKKFNTAIKKQNIVSMWNSTPLKFHNYFSSPILCMKTQEIMWLVLSAPHWISKNLCGNQNNIKFVLLGPSRWDVVLSPWYGKRRLWHSLCNRGYRNISMLWVFGFVWFFVCGFVFFFTDSQKHSKSLQLMTRVACLGIIYQSVHHPWKQKGTYFPLIMLNSFGH